MGRRSLSGKQKTQIPDAFERCITSYGPDAGSIPRIADEAGVKHSMIRHYISNRKDLADAMVSLFNEHYRQLLQAALNVPEIPENASRIIAYFFDEISRHQSEQIIFSQLLAASARDEDIRKSLLALYREMEVLATQMIQSLWPDTPEKKISSTVYSLLSHTRLFHLGFGPERIADATKAAELLSDILRRTP